jgi:hypothetical protein
MRLAPQQHVPLFAQSVFMVTLQVPNACLAIVRAQYVSMALLMAAMLATMAIICLEVSVARAPSVLREHMPIQHKTSVCPA